MKKFFLFIIILLLANLANPVYSITLRIFPNPARVNERVNVTITASFNVTPTCDIEIDFGDGSAPINLGTCYTNPCVLTASHTYTTPGYYTITAKRSPSFCYTPPDPPDPATSNVTVLDIQCTPLNIVSNSLPEATVNKPYFYKFQVSGGEPPITFELVNGSLPSGLSLSSSGIISGTPENSGNYNFTIKAFDSCPTGTQSTQKTFTLKVKEQSISAKVDVIPSQIKIPRNITSYRSLNYTVSSSYPNEFTLISDTGYFYASGEIIGEFDKSLKIKVKNGRGSNTEVVQIPVGVIKRAEKINSSKIFYKRFFKGERVSVAVISEVKIGITTEAGAEFQIKRLQIYFNNKKPQITVYKNQKNLKAYAKIDFTGSGILQGYWEVDGRILSNVHKHLTYGRSVIIETPDFVKFPTYSPGTHIVRFVITNPKITFSLPEAIYFVTTYEKKMAEIILINPPDGSKLNYTPPTFEWKSKKDFSYFIAEFFKEEKPKEVIFSAYSFSNYYKMPRSIFQKVFAPNKTYKWSVKGFDKKANLAGKSSTYSFSFKSIKSFVPGQIIVAVYESNKKLINKLCKLYNLKVIDSFKLKSVKLDIWIFHTSEDIFSLINKISKEEGVIIVQPNFILRSLVEPFADLQKIANILNFKKLHTYLTGRGVKVAVIDTGVDLNHKDLKDRILISKNFLKSLYKPEIHGTAVAGIISASINGYGIEGVAPESSLIALRACRQISNGESLGECYTTSISKALDYALINNVKIVNLSIGVSYKDKLISKMIELGSKKGILFIAPVGNNRWQKTPMFPASHPDVIAVGGLCEDHSPFPNKEVALKSDILVPSQNIFTTIPNNKFNFMSGTSMSSAIVSGIMALKAEKNKNLTKKDINFHKDFCKWVNNFLKVLVCKY